MDTIRREAPEPTPGDPNNVVVGSCEQFKYEIRMVNRFGIETSSSVRSKAIGFEKKSAAGWVIFLSVLVMIYQVFALLQLFLHCKLLHIKIPILKAFWTLFFIIVSQ